jgi:hypothetical protein
VVAAAEPYQLALVALVHLVVAMVEQVPLMDHRQLLLLAHLDTVRVVVVAVARPLTFHQLAAVPVQSAMSLFVGSSKY